jgi:hypothetical protein
VREEKPGSFIERSFFPLPSPHFPFSAVPRQLLRLLVPRVLLAEPAVLAQFEALGRLLAILRRAVIPALTVQARKRNDVSHKFLLVVLADSKIERLEEYIISQSAHLAICEFS